MAAYTVIDDAGLFYNSLLYVGNDGTGHAITGVGFQPDFTWIKNRDAADFHILTDSPRGATKYLQSNSDAAEVTHAESLQSFDSDGFTVGNIAQINTSPEDYASWNFKGGTTSGITTNGSTTITPSAYSFNAAAGISILKYVGDTSSGAKVAHGLGVIPTFIIVKNYNAAENWGVYLSSIGNTKYLKLDTTAATTTSATAWNDTDPDSVNFTLGNSGAFNGTTMTAYCFAPIKGFSHFGSYLGNGNADGQFVYTDFRPGFLLLKRYSTTGQWMLYDSKRLGYNELNYDFQTTNTNAERTTGPYLDILSNGFKLRNTDTDFNGSGQSILFAAFASNPLVNSSGVPGNAR